MTTAAKLFMSGRSQAVRLPKALRFAGDEVIAKRFGNGVPLLLGSLVMQRVRKIGVRRALGASTGDVVRVLIGWLSLWIGIGAVLGLGLAVQLAGPLSQSLYDESRLGSFSVLGTLAVMLVALAVAAVVPLRRALRIAPTEALRED